jgi:D-3-phosphoglycerate dehydrogenase
MRVLIADKFERVGVDGLKEIGCDVVTRPDLKADDLPTAMREIDPRILIVRSTKVTAEALKSGANLGLVIRAGAGIDNIDMTTASSLGVFVSNCPGKNSIAVAELILGLILSVDRRIPDQVRDLRAGSWNKSEYSKARGLHGRTLGIVGLGQIGREVAKRAKSFGMHVIAWSRNFTTADAEHLGIGYAQTPLEVARAGDVVSVNVAATAETKHLCNAEFFEAMKQGAYFINTARGSVVDEAALVQAIRAKGLRAGLDVFQNEPPGGVGDFGNPVVQEPGVYGTHHVGASTDQAQVAIAHEVLRIVGAFIRSGEVPNCVNRLAKSSASYVLAVRHHNRPGVLAHVFRVLAERSINVEEVENISYHGAVASLARIHLDSKPVEDDLQAIRSGNPHVISVELSGLNGRSS